MVTPFHYSTYFIIDCPGIAVDQNNNAYVTGMISSYYSLQQVNPIQSDYGGGGWDAFVSRLSYDEALSTLSLDFSTYLGGTGDDRGVGIAVDTLGNPYVTGYTIAPLTSRRQVHYKQPMQEVPLTPLLLRFCFTLDCRIAI